MEVCTADASDVHLWDGCASELLTLVHVGLLATRSQASAVDGRCEVSCLLQACRLPAFVSAYATTKPMITQQQAGCPGSGKPLYACWQRINCEAGVAAELRAATQQLRTTARRDCPQSKLLHAGPSVLGVSAKTGLDKRR